MPLRLLSITKSVVPSSNSSIYCGARKLSGPCLQRPGSPDVLRRPSAVIYYQRPTWTRSLGPHSSRPLGKQSLSYVHSLPFHLISFFTTIVIYRSVSAAAELEPQKVVVFFHHFFGKGWFICFLFLLILPPRQILVISTGYKPYYLSDSFFLSNVE